MCTPADAAAECVVTCCCTASSLCTLCGSNGASHDGGVPTQGAWTPRPSRFAAAERCISSRRLWRRELGPTPRAFTGCRVPVMCHVGCTGACVCASRVRACMCLPFMCMPTPLYPTALHSQHESPPCTHCAHPLTHSHTCDSSTSLSYFISPSALNHHTHTHGTHAHTHPHIHTHPYTHTPHTHHSRMHTRTHAHTTYDRNPVSCV